MGKNEHVCGLDYEKEYENNQKTIKRLIDENEKIQTSIIKYMFKSVKE